MKQHKIHKLQLDYKYIFLFSVGVIDLNGQRMDAPRNAPKNAPNGETLKDVHILDSSELTKGSNESAQLSRIGNQLCIKEEFQDYGPSYSSWSLILKVQRATRFSSVVTIVELVCLSQQYGVRSF